MADDIWLRRIDEPEKPYQLFKDFLALPLLTRTISAVAKKRKITLRTVERYSVHYDWRARATAYDRHKARRSEQIEEEAMRAAADQEAKKWSDRRAAHREQLFLRGEELDKRADQMLTFPLFTTKEQVAADGKTIVHVHPAKWSLTSLIAMIGMAAELKTFATGLAGNADPLDDIDLKTLTRAEMVLVSENKPLPKKKRPA